MAMGTMFSRAHVVPSWNIWQEPCWRNQFQQPKDAGDASARRWSCQGGIHGEDWLSHLSDKVLWAEQFRSRSALFYFPNRRKPVCFLPSSGADLIVTFLKLFIPALCTSICDLYQLLIFGESSLPVHFCATHLLIS